MSKRKCEFNVSDEVSQFSVELRLKKEEEANQSYSSESSILFGFSADKSEVSGTVSHKKLTFSDNFPKSSFTKNFTENIHNTLSLQNVLKTMPACDNCTKIDHDNEDTTSTIIHSMKDQLSISLNSTESFKYDDNVFSDNSVLTSQERIDYIYSKLTCNLNESDVNIDLFEQNMDNSNVSTFSSNYDNLKNSDGTPYTLKTINDLSQFNTGSNDGADLNEEEFELPNDCGKTMFENNQEVVAVNHEILFPVLQDEEDSLSSYFNREQNPFELSSDASQTFTIISTGKYDFDNNFSGSEDSFNITDKVRDTKELQDFTISFQSKNSLDYLESFIGDEMRVLANIEDEKDEGLEFSEKVVSVFEKVQQKAAPQFPEVTAEHSRIVKENLLPDTHLLSSQERYDILYKKLSSDFDDSDTSSVTSELSILFKKDAYDDHIENYNIDVSFQELNVTDFCVCENDLSFQEPVPSLNLTRKLNEGIEDDTRLSECSNQLNQFCNMAVDVPEDISLDASDPNSSNFLTLFDLDGQIKAPISSQQSEDSLDNADKRLRASIDRIASDKSLLLREEAVTDQEMINEQMRNLVKFRILQTMDNLHQCNVNGDPLVFVIKRNTWEECTFEEDRLQLRTDGTVKNKNISYNSKRTREKFNLMVYLLNKIYSLLVKGEICMQREIYYQLKSYSISQVQIYNALYDISLLLDVDIWYLPIMSTSKGLVFGDLQIILSSNEVLCCNIGLGTLIPQEIIKIKSFESPAYFILVVEKDAIFKKLLDEDIPNKLTRPFIMVTGKGFPDINTRLFIRKLTLHLKIPVFILVDADAHGIEIMLTYRFGSKKLAGASKKLALPNMKWLGVYPSEIVPLNITRQSSSKKEIEKVKQILKRPYVNKYPRLVKELNVLLEKKFKAEIEGVIKSSSYLTDFYLNSKLYNQDYF